MNKLRDLFSLTKTPQNRPIPNSNQVPNSAGGFSFKLNDWARLDRFLILGSEGGTYYIRPRPLTAENAEAVIRCIDSNGLKVIERAVAVSEGGRAPKNDPALFVLALCASVGDNDVRRAALEALPRVARTGTHLFHFMAFCDNMRGWGRGLRRGVANWYNTMPAGKLAYQSVKYQSRDGWSHRDALRLAHPHAATDAHNAIYQWITKGWDEAPALDAIDADLRLIWAFEQAKSAHKTSTIVNLIVDHKLPWEAIPTQFLADPKVWDAMLPNMPMTAMIRNLARMTANGLLRPLSPQARTVTERLRDAQRLQKARIHPVQVLAALLTYQSGRGVRGSLTWEPIVSIVDALNDAFYASFGNVTSTNKRMLLGLDVSGSMAGGTIANVPGLSPRVASAAMALITAATEPSHTFMAFESSFVPINISPRQRLDDVVRHVSGRPFGGTDCALPMLYAMKQRLPVDAFVVYTDSETWHGKIHPVQALNQYRDKMGIAAKLIVVGMVSNGFSIADPNDAGMLDVVGFDTATPNVMAEFMMG